MTPCGKYPTEVGDLFDFPHAVWEIPDGPWDGRLLLKIMARENVEGLHEWIATSKDANANR